MKKELLEQIRKELEECKKRKEDNREILSTLIQKHIGEISEEDSNHIYMYMGAFKVGQNGKLFFEERNSENIDFKSYRDLEQQEIHCVMGKDALKFEQKNMVLVPEDYSEQYSFEEEYLDKQIEFLEQSLKTNQEEAKQHLVRTYIKKS